MTNTRTVLQNRANKCDVWFNVRLSFQI